MTFFTGKDKIIGVSYTTSIGDEVSFGDIEGKNSSLLTFSQDLQLIGFFGASNETGIQSIGAVRKDMKCIIEEPEPVKPIDYTKLFDD